MSIRHFIGEILEWFPNNFPTREIIKKEAVYRIARLFIKQKYRPINYNSQDWDNLIILDACRFDTFAKYNPFPQKVRRVNSNASHTTPFLKRNFFNHNGNTVYITANPQAAGFESSFVEVRHVWRSHWDKSRNTVMPASVVDEALKAAVEYPDQRLIIHFMQPHYPFIGPTGKKIENQGSFRNKRENASPWEMLFAGKLSEDLVKKAYEENLQLVLPYVEKLASNLKGKSVITGDHGNLFGKKIKLFPWKIYGHPPNLKDEELTAVPWLELPYEERKETILSRPKIQRSPGEEVKQRLKHLGYV